MYPSKLQKKQSNKRYYKNYKATHAAVIKQRNDKYSRWDTSRYSHLKNRHKQLGLGGKVITFDQWKAVVSNPCFYCGGALPTNGHGVDRINSLLGYILGNVHPCCRWCNRAKDVRTEAEFKQWIQKIYFFWIKQ